MKHRVLLTSLAQSSKADLSPVPSYRLETFTGSWADLMLVWLGAISACSAVLLVADFLPLGGIGQVGAYECDGLGLLQRAREQQRVLLSFNTSTSVREGCYLLRQVMADLDIV